MSDPFTWARAAFSAAQPRGRLAERVATQLRERLPDDHLVLASHLPRDGGERVALVVVGRERVVVVEPRDEDGDFVCYQDHWYRRSSAGATHAYADSPSVRARRDAVRIHRDLATGGEMNTQVDALVVLTVGRASDVGSSCVPVIVGVDALARDVLRMPAGSAERTHAVAEALARPIRLDLA